MGNIFLWATGIYNNIFSSTTSQKETLDSFIQQQKKSQSEMERKFEQFAIPDLNSNTKDPGFGIVLIIKLLPQSQFRRKYIMDLGETTDKNRISLYLDPNDILTYELIDSVGSVYNTKIPNSEYRFNEFMLLYCEYGFNSNFSYFRIFINGYLITQNKYIFKIRLPQNINVSLFVGGDLNGKNNMHMTIKENIVRNATLGKSGRDSVFNYLNNKYNLQL